MKRWLAKSNRWNTYVIAIVSLLYKAVHGIRVFSLSLSLYIRDQRSATALISSRVKALTWNYTSPLGHGDYLSFYYTPRRINFDFGGRNIIDRLNVFSSRSNWSRESKIRRRGKDNNKKNRLASSRNFTIDYSMRHVKIFFEPIEAATKQRIQSISSYLININWPHGKHRESHDHASQSILFRRAAVNEHKSKEIFPGSEPVRSSPSSKLSSFSVTNDP